MFNVKCAMLFFGFILPFVAMSLILRLEIAQFCELLRCPTRTTNPALIKTAP